MQKKSLILATSLMSVFAISNSKLYAQAGLELQYGNNDVNISGKISEKISVNFFNPEWIAGDVRLADNKIYNNLNLMYDIKDDRPIFKTDEGKVQAFAAPVKEFILYADGDKKSASRFRNGFPTVDGNDTKSFYEVLSEGALTLLKKYQIKTVEERPMGSIYAVKQNKKVANYYLLYKEKMIPFKRDKKQFLSILELADSRNITGYINSKKPNFRDDEELKTLVNYFNSAK